MEKCEKVKERCGLSFYIYLMESIYLYCLYILVFLFMKTNLKLILLTSLCGKVNSFHWAQIQSATCVFDAVPGDWSQFSNCQTADPLNLSAVPVPLPLSPSRHIPIKRLASLSALWSQQMKLLCAEEAVKRRQERESWTILWWAARDRGLLFIP